MPIDQLKAATPTVVRAAARDSARWLGRLTSAWRPLPEFLVIGTKRGGTTTLFRALQDHPLVLPMFPAAQDLKSPHYFDLDFDRGEAWYRSHFATRRARRARREGMPVTGEASPYYLFHPGGAARVRMTVPDARLVVLLRDPVDRAFSHHWDRVKEGFETLSFAEAIDREDERLASERERLERDPGAVSPEYEHHSYVARGRYAEQLEQWYQHFPREQLLVMRSEDLYRDPASVYARTLAFLGLTPHEYTRPYTKLHGHTDRPTMPADQAERLRSYFAPHNERLAELLGTEVWW